MEKTKFARPDWQNTAVQKYLDNLPSGQYQGLFNPCVSFLSPSFNPFHRDCFPRALAHHIAPAVYVHPFPYLYINRSSLLVNLYLSSRHTLTSQRNREGSSFTSRVL